ncbi:MAG: hypothetical protein FWF36_08860 [Propionibacteriaceae bacterium]|nr:hypothetical protein [Propionibacteriaceae bacterium]
MLVTAVWLVCSGLVFLGCVVYRLPAWPYWGVFTAMAAGMYVLVFKTTHSRPTGLAGLVGQGQFWSKAGLAYQKRVTKALVLVIVLFLVGLGMLFVVGWLNIA